MSLQELREALSDDVAALFDATAALIHDVDPDTVVVAWPRQGTVGFGVGPKKMSEQYVYISTHARHINLGFYYGADLDDPHALLGGTGKSMRHFKVAHVDDLQTPGLRDLVTAATKHLPKLDR